MFLESPLWGHSKRCFFFSRHTFFPLRTQQCNFKVYPELEQLQKMVRRDLSSFSFCLKNWQNDSMEGFLARRPWKTIFTFNLNAAARLFLSFADIHNYYIFKNCLSGQLGLPFTPLTWLCETTARYKTDCCNETWSPQIPCCHPDQLPARWCSAQWQREPPWSQSGSCLIPTRTRSWPVLCQDSRGTWELSRSSKGCQGFILSSGLSCQTHEQPTNYSPPKAAWRGVGWPRSGHGSGWDGTKGGHCESNNLFLFYFLSWNFHNIWWSVSFTQISPQNQVPKTCKNFIALCTGSSGYGYYHTTFHR